MWQSLVFFSWVLGAGGGAKPQSILAPDGYFEFQVGAQAPVTVKLNPGRPVYEFQIAVQESLQAESPQANKSEAIDSISCEVAKERWSPSVRLTEVSKSLRNAASSLQLTKFRARLWGPRVGFEQHFRLLMPSAGKNPVSQISSQQDFSVWVALFSTEQNSVLCIQKVKGLRNESETQKWQGVFEKSVESVAKTISFPSVPREEYYREIQLMSLGAQVVGFIEVINYRTPAGDRTLAFQSMMLPRSSDDVVIQDSSTLELVGPDGKLLSIADQNLENGELRRLLRMISKGDIYHIEGVFFAKPFQAQIQSTLRGTAWVNREVAQKMLNGGHRELAFDVWIPDIDPTQPTAMRVKKKSGRDVDIQLGPMTIPARLDRQGWSEQMTMELGKMKVEFRRVLREREHLL